MPLRGNNFQQTAPTITVNGSNVALGTSLRQLGEFIKQYITGAGKKKLAPLVTNPATVTITPAANTRVHYTWGPQYPTAKVDNITCFEYVDPIVLTNNKGGADTTLYAVAYKVANGKVAANDQSAVVIAKFKVAKA